MDAPRPGSRRAAPRLLLAAAAVGLASLAPSANAELQACLEALGQLSTAPYNASLPFLNGVTGAWLACRGMDGMDECGGQGALFLSPSHASGDATHVF